MSLIYIYIPYLFHSIDCNLVDGEYILVPEQGVAQEVVQELAPEPATEDMPTQLLKASPGFMHNYLYMLLYYT